MITKFNQLANCISFLNKSDLLVADILLFNQLLSDSFPTVQIIRVRLKQ
ncbi:hypothetical protein ATC1_11216 [Flexilinea flocculi]|jgi:hypothetical protein|uniref:Uncharacterized protein n=1 Tax=Flexilinea flocculi TaxID=1678840 RepID=A0A0K8P9V8_9CHLR|nr:hypothetical protein ATC1_11216 [Flexilinea flocculi]